MDVEKLVAVLVRMLPPMLPPDCTSSKLHLYCLELSKGLHGEYARPEQQQARRYTHALANLDIVYAIEPS